jgi:putative transposase
MRTSGIKLVDSDIQRRSITQAKTTEQRGGWPRCPVWRLVQSVNDSQAGMAQLSSRLATGETQGRQWVRPTDEVPKDHRQSFSAHPQRFRVRPGGRCLWRRRAKSRCAGHRELPRTVAVTIIREPTALLTRASWVDVAARSTTVVSAKAGWMWGPGSVGDDRHQPTTYVSTGEPSPLVASSESCDVWSARRRGDKQGSNNRDKTRRKVAIAHIARWRGRRARLSPEARRWRWFARLK